MADGTGPAALARLAAGGWSFRPFYETNDDAGMRLIAEGGFVPGSPPEGLLLFIHAALGHLLARAYAWRPGWPWYDLMLVAGLVLAAVAAGAVLGRLRGPARVIPAVALAAGLGLPSIVTLQFTRVAILLSGAGALLMLDAALGEDRPEARKSWRWAVGPLLVVLGGVVRAQAPVLAVPLVAALALPAVIRRPAVGRTRWPWAAAGLVAAATLLGSVGVGRLDQWWYEARPGWADFRAYNWMRVDITEYRRRDPATRQAIERAAGWSATDLTLLGGWFYTSRDVFGLERVRAGHAALGAPPPPSLVAGARWTGRAAWRTLLASLLPLAFVAGTALLGRQRGARVQAVTVAITTVATLVLVHALYKEAPPRVLWPLWTVAGAALLRLTASATLPSSRLARWAGVLLLAGATLASLTALHREVETRLAWTARIAADLEALPRPPSRIHLDVGGAFPWEFVTWPFAPRLEAQGLRVLPIGGAAHTPLVQDFVRREGLPDLALALCTEPRMRLLASSLLLPAIVRYVGEHFAKPVVIRPDFQGAVITTYRCDPATRPDGAQPSS